MTNLKESLKANISERIWAYDRMYGKPGLICLSKSLFQQLMSRQAARYLQRQQVPCIMQIATLPYLVKVRVALPSMGEHFSYIGEDVDNIEYLAVNDILLL